MQLRVDVCGACLGMGSVGSGSDGSGAFLPRCLSFSSYGVWGACWRVLMGPACMSVYPQPFQIRRLRSGGVQPPMGRPRGFRVCLAQGGFLLFCVAAWVHAGRRDAALWLLRERLCAVWLAWYGRTHPPGSRGGPAPPLDGEASPTHCCPCTRLCRVLSLFAGAATWLTGCSVCACAGCALWSFHYRCQPWVDRVSAFPRLMLPVGLLCEWVCA